MPCTAVIERLFYGTVYDIKVKFFLTLLAIGVGLATITSLSVNPFGFAIMVFSVLITSAHQTVRLLSWPLSSSLGTGVPYERAATNE